MWFTIKCDSICGKDDGGTTCLMFFIIMQNVWTVV